MLRKEAISATAKLALFPVSKDECNTKEDTGKSMKNVLHITVVCQKAPLELKRRQTVKNQVYTHRHY